MNHFKDIIIEENLYKENLEEDDEIYQVTPWGILWSILDDYNIDTSHIKGKVGSHIIEDFMESMKNAGYIKEYNYNEE